MMYSYRTDDGVRYWTHLQWNGLDQQELAELFFKLLSKNISKHIDSKMVLEEWVVVNYQLTTTRHGAIRLANQSKKALIITGIWFWLHTVCAPRGIQFRHYASTVLKEHLIKGVMDDERLKNLGGGFLL